MRGEAVTGAGRSSGPFGRLADVCRNRLFAVRSTDTLFNQYADRKPEFDRRGAAAMRRRNLLGYLGAYERPPGVVVVAEAPGPWGCRFSGVPITSEEQLVDPGFPLGGESSGVSAAPHREYSARIFWRVMGGYFPHFFVWNAVPLHPHPPGEPMSIRTPGVGEIRSWGWLTGMVIEMVVPEVVVALGRKAEFQLSGLGIECVYVRHPSQGGAVAFEEGMREVFG